MRCWVFEPDTADELDAVGWAAGVEDAVAVDALGSEAEAIEMTDGVSSAGFAAALYERTIERIGCI